MLQSYLKIGWRNLKGNLGYSAINIAGLAAGMTVWHFAGGAHIKAGHVLPQGLHVHRVVQDMAALGRLFRDAGISGNERVAIPSS